MKATILLYNIYTEYLKTTVKLVELLEQYAEKEITDVNPDAKKKYTEFANHAHELILTFNEDLHKLLRINQELKELLYGNEKD